VKVISLFLFLPACLPESPPLERVTLAAQTALTLEGTFTTKSASWARVERWHDAAMDPGQEAYVPDGRGDVTGELLDFFGGESRPASSRFLLYYGVGWDKEDDHPPVLLVQGANDTVERGWVDPGALGGFGCGSILCPHTGLAQKLMSTGRRVFAIGYPHRQGDNFYWAQGIHDAITVIQKATGAKKVDVVGWSKGAFAARMYASSVRASWGSDYQGGIRRLVLLGNPGDGFDYAFRHGIAHDFSVFPECGAEVNAPAPHSAVLCWGLWRHHPELDIYGEVNADYYAGQRQMVARLDDQYPLSVLDVDWFTTYEGGLGLFSAGQGIDRAVNEDSLVATLQSTPVPASVSTYLLCGGAPTIPTIHVEHTGPSDGVVFISSCLAEQGLENVAGTKLFWALNHLQLGWNPAAMDQIVSWLD
jgi:hypothetical protein